MGLLRGAAYMACTGASSAGLTRLRQWQEERQWSRVGIIGKEGKGAGRMKRTTAMCDRGRSIDSFTHVACKASDLVIYQCH